MGPKKNWTIDEDLVLLRQVNADLPFKAKKGGVMDAWSEPAVTISGATGFTRVVDGKSRRIGSLLCSKVTVTMRRCLRGLLAYQKPMARKKKRELLDSLSSLTDDHKLKGAARSEKAKKKKEEDVAAGVRARDAAMHSLGK